MTTAIDQLEALPEETTIFDQETHVEYAKYKGRWFRVYGDTGIDPREEGVTSADMTGTFKLPKKKKKTKWEYVPGHRWVDANGGEHWFVGNGTIAPGYVKKYIAEGGEVLRRKVGEWEEVK